MAEQEKDQVTEKDSPGQPPGLSAGENSGNETEGCVEQNERPSSAADLRSASYFVLMIAAIFLINAMETGSYRTPWPVAIIALLAGFALLGYSFVKAKQEIFVNQNEERDL